MRDNLDIPDWVPPALKRQADHMRANWGSLTELNRRQLTDARMRDVWQRLQNRRFASSALISRTADFFSDIDDGIIGGGNDLDISLALVFRDAGMCAAGAQILDGEASIHIGKIIALQQEDRKLIARLRADAALLRKSNHRYGDDACALERVAESLEKKIEDSVWHRLDMIGRSRAPVRRNHGNKLERAYCVGFAQGVRKYFKITDNALHTIVATVAAVMLNPKLNITTARVRDWCKAEEEAEKIDPRFKKKPIEG